jgi:hypothetical protein
MPVTRSFFAVTTSESRIHLAMDRPEQEVYYDSALSDISDRIQLTD